MGRRQSGIASDALRRHIETCKFKYQNIEQLVDHLRSNYPKYRRQKLHPLTMAVQRTIDLVNSKESRTSNVSHGTTTATSSSQMNIDDEDGSVVGSSRRAKRQKFFVQEEVSSVSSQSETSSSNEQQDDAVLISEEPKFDLVKSMLRATYSASKDSVKSKRKEAIVEKSVELEDAVSSKVAPMKIDLVGGNLNLGKIEIERKGKCLTDEQGKEKEVEEGQTFSDLGGMSVIVEELEEDFLSPIFNPCLYKLIGIHENKAGILLHGPPGCGKTKLADTIAYVTELPYYKVSAPEMVSGVSGESEENIRNLFAKAYRTAPSIVFIDEIDAIASKRDNMQRGMEKRIVTQLMTCMDVSHRPVQPDVASSADISFSENGYVLVIGATNSPDDIDPALRRPGRFDREINLGLPDEEARLEILKLFTCKFRLEDSLDLLKIARCTPGFAGADLEELVKKAGKLTAKRLNLIKKAELQKEAADGKRPKYWWKKPWLPKDMRTIVTTQADFEIAIKMINPSSKKEGFSSLPNVKWEDIGGMEFIRNEFIHSIVGPIKNPDAYKEFHADPQKGFLLYGPPGCGKTLIAKAVATEAGANFIYINGPEILSKYVGESERAVRTIFLRARKCSPCIIFIDEVDALTTNRGNEGGSVVESLLKQLLVEMDGAYDRTGVYVIGATNSPDRIASALLRPGRLGKQLHVCLPTPDDRGLILKALAGKKPIDPSVDLLDIGKQTTCDNFSGADLWAVMSEATTAAVAEKVAGSNLSTTIHRRHFDIALQKVSPSVSQKDIQFFYNWSVNKTTA